MRSQRGARVMLAVVVIVAASSCISPPRNLPAVPAGAWLMRAGDARRAGYAMEGVPRAPEIIWKKQAARGLAAPLIVHDPIIVASTTSRAVVTLSAETGNRYWVDRFRGAIAGAALRRDDLVFVATGGREERLFALDLARGRRVWTRRLGPMMVEPLLAGDTIFAATEAGTLHALSAREGSPLWQARFGAAPAAAPTPYRESLLHVTRRDTLYVVERANGRVQARLDLRSTPSAPPALHEHLVVIPLHSGEIVAVALTELREAWRITLPQPVLAAPAFAPDGAVYLLTRAGDVFRVRHGMTQPDTIARVGGAVSTSFTLTRDGLLVGRLDGCLYHVGFEGSIIWERHFDDSIVAPVAVRSGALYVPLLRGELVKMQ